VRSLGPIQPWRTAGRRTNLALLVALAVSIVTGGLAFATGTTWVLWISVAHGCAAASVVVLSPWKSVIARRGLARARPGRATSIALGALLVAALASGLAHSTGLRSFVVVTAMQIHVGAALLIVPLTAWHVAARPARWHRSDASRRQLLRAGALAATGTWLYAAVEATTAAARLPGARRRESGSYETGSGDPERMPVTQWLDDDVPSLHVPEWRLVVSGPAGSREWGYEDLAPFADVIVAVLDCTGGWWAEQAWRGVLLSRLLDLGDARSLVVTSVTGFRRRFPSSDASRLLLATAVGGRSLSPGHGGPARIVAPDRRGFWWVKWVQSIEASTAPWWLQPPFPLS
jgi:DMSO/TMAO reductase YedYZ molybdopterin-dependent catalytic subunit